MCIVCKRELPQSAQTADLLSRSVFLFLSAFVLFLAPPELVVRRTIIIKFITMSRWPPPYHNHPKAIIIVCAPNGQTDGFYFFT